MLHECMHNLKSAHFMYLNTPNPSNKIMVYLSTGARFKNAPHPFSQPHSWGFDPPCLACLGCIQGPPVDGAACEVFYGGAQFGLLSLGHSSAMSLSLIQGSPGTSCSCR